MGSTARNEGFEWLKSTGLGRGKKALCLVDGQHYPPVTAWAVQEVQSQGIEVAGMAFLGGTEKIGDAKSDFQALGLDVPLFLRDSSNEGLLDWLKQLVEDIQPELAIDLSDDPVVDSTLRFRMASCFLMAQIPYIGADFFLFPPSRESVLTKKSISITGSGKRVGKTAVSVSVARILKQNGILPAIVAMGRGGPPEPDVILQEDIEMNADFLLEIAASGAHAASDYWEDAILAQAPTVGCRRCGGGLAGNPFISNVKAGARIANDMKVDTVIMEGSGPTQPPVATDRNILIVGTHQPAESVIDYLNEYRILRADLAILTMCEEPLATPEKVQEITAAIRNIRPDLPIAHTVFRPEPLEDIEDQNVFLATTAPETILPRLTDYLESQHHCRVVGTSPHLSNRKLLREDLEGVIEEADLLLTEIKAASIDVAARTAKDHGLEVVFLHNKLEQVGGTITDLEERILSLQDTED